MILNYNFTISFSYFVGSILRCIRYFYTHSFAFNILLGTPFFISALTTASAYVFGIDPYCIVMILLHQYIL